ncbi:MAG: adenylate/guanylate cyclase domain-containing protein [Chitinophagaceae bacterium]
MKKKQLLICISFLAVIYSQAQPKATLKDSVRVNVLLDSSKHYINTEPDKAISIATEARNLSQEIGFKKGEALALKNIGLVYYYQGKFVQTLEYWNQSLQILQSINDELGQANLQGNIGAVFFRQGDEVSALKHHLEALALAEKSGDQMRICFTLNNIAGIYFEKKSTRDKALDYLLRAYPIAEKLGDTATIALISGNIGQIYLERKDDAKALEYYNKCLKAGSKENAAYAYIGLGNIYLNEGDVDKAFAYHSKAYELAKQLNEVYVIPSLMGLANTFIAKKDYRSALGYYEKAETVALGQGSVPALKDVYDSLAGAYAAMGDFEKAFRYQRNLDQVKDTLFNVTTQKKLNSLQFEFDLQKKEGEITLLTKDKALQEVEIKRQRIVKNAFAIGLALIAIILLVIYRDYRIKIRTNKILDMQKAQIEQLLLNILPMEVARELQTTGNATPKSYEDVTVMFTDFKSFTAIADQLSPQELVQELNNSFMAFDEIVGKYGLEKIKTIGDSYMCAGGLPTPDGDHHYKVIRAALEIQAYVLDNIEKRKAQNLPVWEIRIGVHNGPVVAGVVGRKKYAYDIWGSTVNIASRMESSGVPGQVNISETTYEKIRDRFVCNYRGKVYAKNVGEIDMYLVDHETGHLESTTESPAKTSTPHI